MNNTTNGMQRVTFELPGPVWFDLAGIAEKHEVTVADLIAEAIRDRVRAEHASDAASRRRRQQVIDMVSAGHTDAVICERLGETRDYVGTTRRRAGLSPNRPGQAIKSKTTQNKEQAA